MRQRGRRLGRHPPRQTLSWQRRQRARWMERPALWAALRRRPRRPRPHRQMPRLVQWLLQMLPRSRWLLRRRRLQIKASARLHIGVQLFRRPFRCLRRRQLRAHAIQMLRRPARQPQAHGTIRLFRKPGRYPRGRWPQAHRPTQTCRRPCPYLIRRRAQAHATTRLLRKPHRRLRGRRPRAQRTSQLLKRPRRKPRKRRPQAPATLRRFHRSRRAARWLPITKRQSEKPARISASTPMSSAARVAGNPAGSAQSLAPMTPRCGRAVSPPRSEVSIHRSSCRWAWRFSRATRRPSPLWTWTPTWQPQSRGDAVESDVPDSPTTRRQTRQMPAAQRVSPRPSDFLPSSKASGRPMGRPPMKVRRSL
mmetsp:Transcript_56370/g.157058  ORF Transcript_56370/g.157058 Transcript_56370/m.157058 type:complete len:364 (-) Transcript_56370:1134-2225(-)